MPTTFYIASLPFQDALQNGGYGRASGQRAAGPPDLSFGLIHVRARECAGRSRKAAVLGMRF